MRFSVIIPTYGRPERLRQCLAGLAAMNYDSKEFEVIVVDDGSPEPVEPVVHSLQDRLALTSLRQENAGPASARNLGAQHARGDWLAFLDDDCIPQPDWLQQLEKEAHRSPGAMLGGVTANGCPENIFAAANEVLLNAVIGWLQRHDSPLQFFPSNNLALSASDFHNIGGFDGRMHLAGGEDREFCARWIASGRPLATAAGARIDHFHPQTLKGFLSMHFRYGRGAALLHSLQNTGALRFAKCGLYVHLLRTTSAVPSRSSRFVATLLVALSQVAAGMGFFLTRWGAAAKVRRGSHPPCFKTHVAVGRSACSGYIPDGLTPPAAGHRIGVGAETECPARGRPGSNHRL